VWRCMPGKPEKKEKKKDRTWQRKLWVVAGWKKDREKGESNAKGDGKAGLSPARGTGVLLQNLITSPT